MNSDTALLQLMLTPGLGNKTVARLLAQAAYEGSSPEEIALAAIGELTQHYQLAAGVAAAVEGVRSAAEHLAETLERHQIRVLALGMPDYPLRLRRAVGSDAPPLLFVRGNTDLFSQPAVAFAGSRKASEKGLGITIAAATTLALRGGNVISGYANGIDLAAHSAALTAGGTTAFVLAEGILQFRPKREVSEFLTERNHLIVSEFPPNLRWIARNAMQRNRTIIGLSDAMLIIEAGPDGGTFAAGEEALKLRRPLFVVEFTSPALSAAGNSELLRRGAHPVHRDETGQPNLSGVFKVLEGADASPSVPPPPGPAPMPLFDKPSPGSYPSDVGHDAHATVQASDCPRKSRRAGARPTNRTASNLAIQQHLIEPGPPTLD